MAILKIKKLIEDLEQNQSIVLGTVTKTVAGAVSGTATYASSAGNAGTAYKATTAGNAGTSYRANRADFGSSGTAKLTGTGAWWSTSGIQG